ncbi:KOW motif-containing protein [Chloroflexota bacterium]
MEAGDKVRVIEGEHKGKTGEVIGKWQGQMTEAGGQGGTGFGFSGGWWRVKFDDGSQPIIKEALMEVTSK